MLPLLTDSQQLRLTLNLYNIVLTAKDLLDSLATDLNRGIVAMVYIDPAVPEEIVLHQILLHGGSEFISDIDTDHFHRGPFLMLYSGNNPDPIFPSPVTISPSSTSFVRVSMELDNCLSLILSPHLVYPGIYERSRSPKSTGGIGSYPHQP